jgi:hypothetical protein
MTAPTLRSRARTLLRSHWAILVHACAVAILIASPLLLFPSFAKEAYRGINIAHFGTDNHFYLTRGRDVLDGHGLGNSILREGKEARDPFSTMNERVLLAPFRWLGLADALDVSTLYTALNAIGIFLLVILIYAFTYQLSDDKRLSALAATFVIGGSSFVFYRAFFYSDMNLYGRAMTPYVSSVALFVFLNLLIRHLVRPRAWTGICATVAFGALFYIYLFAWTYALTLNGILVGLFLLRRAWKKGRDLMLVTVGGMLLGSGTLSFLITSLMGAESRAMSYFHFVEHSRAPMFSLVGAVLLAIFAFYWWKNRTDERLPILFGFIITGWVVLNQQLVTGIRIQPGHYYWYFIVPIGIILALFMCWSFVPRRWRGAVSTLLFLAVYVNLIGGQYLSTVKSLPVKLEEQRFQPILSVLQQDPVPSVILTAGDDHAFLFVIYTRHDLFWHDSATLYQADLERMKDALIVPMLLNRDARKDIRGFLRRAAEYRLTSDFYSHTYHAIEGFASGDDYPAYRRRVDSKDPSLAPHRDALIEEIATEADAIAADPEGLKNLLSRYGVTYVVWDERRYPEWDLSVLPTLREIISSDGLRLYRFK